MAASDNTLDRLRVQHLPGIQGSGWVDIHPVQTLTHRYPIARQVVRDLKLLIACTVMDDALVLPAVIQAEYEIDDDSQPSVVQTVVSFWCTLRPDDSDPLRGALVDCRLLYLGQISTQVIMSLAYDVLGNGTRLRLNSVRLDNKGGDSLIHATRTPFSQGWGIIWAFESRFFRPYEGKEPSLWTRIGFRTEAGLLPTMFVGNLSLGPDERLEDYPGGPEYQRVGSILHSVNESVRMFLSNVVEIPSTNLPYGYRAIDRTRMKDTLERRFDKDGLCDLAFDLGIDCDNLKSSTLKAMARSLVEYCEDRNMLLGLAKEILRKRPDAEVWAI